MKIFVNSLNRPDTISVHRLLDESGLDYTLILHSEEQRERYLQNPTISPEKILVSNQPVGMALNRNWLLENLVEDGEWYLILDDNITEFQAVPQPEYELPELPVQAQPELYKKLYERPITARQFVEEVCEPSIVEAERIGAKLVGFGSTTNFFFRARKYRHVGYVIGKTQLIKKTSLRYDLSGVQAMDDYLWTAQNLETFGKVLINNYAVALKKHYAPGGIGTYEQRLPAKLRECAWLMERFPGLFRYKEKAGCDPKAEIQIRFSSPAQVEKWRAFMRTRAKAKKA